MTKDSMLHVIHILECVERIVSYTQGDYDILVHDRKTYDAVLRNLQTMSESTQKLDNALKDRHPSIPWEKISGFRNILVHDYIGDIDQKQIVTIIDKYIGDLHKAMTVELPNWKDVIQP